MDRSRSMGELRFGPPVWLSDKHPINPPARFRESFSPGRYQRNEAMLGQNRQIWLRRMDIDVPIAPFLFCFDTVTAVMSVAARHGELPNCTLEARALSLWLLPSTSEPKSET
jgi:hypothetical protein